MPFAAPGRTERKRKTHRVPKSPTSSKKRRGSSAAKYPRLAQEWRRQLDAGEVESQAAIARREGITRARVCQIMSLLRLPPEAQAYLLSLPHMKGQRPLSERAVRTAASIGGTQLQLETLCSLATVGSKGR